MTATTSLRERLLAIADEVDDLHGPGMDGGDARKLGTRIRDAVAGLSTPPAGEWMPIESAPKDGSYILACDDDSHAVVRWDSGFDGGWVYAWHEYDGPLVMHSATHWQSLPPLPEPATQEVG